MTQCKAILLTAMAVAITFPTFAAIPTGYYSEAEGKTGNALKAALQTITGRNFSSVSYSSADTPIAYADENPNNTSQVYLYYKGQYVAKSSDWNKEHLWPQSRGCTASPMKSDLHHLFPEDSNLNSSRGNSPFGVVTNPTKTQDGNKWTSTLFEPRDDVKGNIARALFYMEMRYSDKNFALVDTTPSGNQMGFKTTLFAWHAADPVDDLERRRNDRVYSAQKNRNPYIDHPEYVALVYGLTPEEVHDGDALQIAGNSIAPETASMIATDIPMLKLTAQASTNEWDLSKIGITNTGVAPLTNVKLWRDSNGNGSFDAADVLLGSSEFLSGNTTTITLSSAQRFKSTETTSLFITVSPVQTATSGTMTQVTVNGAGIVHAASGGNDIDPSIVDIISGKTTLTYDNPTPVPSGVTAVINKIFNRSNGDGTGDTVELLVLQDNTSLANLWLKDFSGSGGNDNGGAMQFLDIDAWKGLKAGTMIVLTYNSTASTGNPTVSSKVMRANLNNATLFNVASGSFNLASAEIIMLKSGTRAGTADSISALGFGISSTISNWSAITSGWKTNTSTSQSNGYVYVKNSTRSAADFNREDLGVTTSEVPFGAANNTDNQYFIDSLTRADVNTWKEYSELENGRGTFALTDQ